MDTNNNSLLGNHEQMDSEGRFEDLDKRLTEVKNRIDRKKYIHETKVNTLIGDCEKLIKDNIENFDKDANLDDQELENLKKGTKNLKSFLRALQLDPTHQSEKLYNKVFKKS